ncbi:g13519 [Coccomyxa viridis]|uniref:Magnesium transporter n=1 Tax=Coccomyxa viridis TaxID=1274662 RepID=A0ABP1GH46_9CHLO
MRRPDIEEGDAAQPLLPEALDDEDLAEGRQPSWWEPQHVALPDSPGLSAFANIKESAPGTPNGSRGLESGRQSPRTAASGATRKGGKGGTRESRARRTQWLVINAHGIKTSFTSDKRGLIQKFRLGVPIRDMRLLDPNLLTSETGKILVRDNAIVFSVEHVRLIITADCVIIPQTGFEQSSLSTRFAAMLEDAIIEASQEKEARLTYELAMANRDATSLDDARDFDDRMSDDSSGFRHESSILPFELHVLEVAIGDVCQLCSGLVKELESSGHPILDTLVKHVNTTNLERMRKVKTRHQRLYARVETVREELQRFLEDDDDMAKMCLTRKKELERMVSSGPGERHSFALGSMQRRSMSINIHSSSMSRGPSHQYSTPQGGSPHTQEDTPHEEESEESIEAVENLLESYFMQIDSLYDRLVSMGEYIKDTEEYINIELDSSRNRLIRLEIVLTAGTFAVAIWGLVGSILGENLILPSSITNDVRQFWEVNGITLIVCLLSFLAILGYIRWRRLL